MTEFEPLNDAGPLSVGVLERVAFWPPGWRKVDTTLKPVATLLALLAIVAVPTASCSGNCGGPDTLGNFATWPDVQLAAHASPIEQRI